MRHAVPGTWVGQASVAYPHSRGARVARPGCSHRRGCNNLPRRRRRSSWNEEIFEAAIINRLCGALSAAFTLPFCSLHFCYLYSVGCPAVNVCGCLPAFVTLSRLRGLADWMWRCRGAACPRGDHHNGLTQHLTSLVAADRHREPSKQTTAPTSWPSDATRVEQVHAPRPSVLPVTYRAPRPFVVPKRQRATERVRGSPRPPSATRVTDRGDLRPPVDLDVILAEPATMRNPAEDRDACAGDGPTALAPARCFLSSVLRTHSGCSSVRRSPRGRGRPSGTSTHSYRRDLTLALSWPRQRATRSRNAYELLPVLTVAALLLVRTVAFQVVCLMIGRLSGHAWPVGLSAEVSWESSNFSALDNGQLLQHHITSLHGCVNACIVRWFVHGLSQVS